MELIDALAHQQAMYSLAGVSFGFGAGMLIAGPLAYRIEVTLGGWFERKLTSIVAKRKLRRAATATSQEPQVLAPVAPAFLHSR